MDRYYKLSKYLKERFGAKVQRVTLEGGFTCPNIDGARSVGGCTFCTEDGSSSGARNASHSIYQQVLDGIKSQGRRFGVENFIAYFQSYTNTYAPVKRHNDVSGDSKVEMDVGYLRTLYDEAVKHPAIKVLAIGTRPDCVPEEVIDLFEEYTERGLEVWVDIGVQTSHNDTLETINRAHSYEEFANAANRLAARKNPLLRICTHVILGLPGESNEMILQTAEALAKTPIDDLKIHQLCIFKGTPMEIDFLNGDLAVFERQEYIELLANFMRRIPANVVIQRIMGEGKEDELVAPMWADRGQKQHFLDAFHAYMEENDFKQGDLVKSLI